MKTQLLLLICMLTLSPSCFGTEKSNTDSIPGKCQYFYFASSDNGNASGNSPGNSAKYSRQDIWNKINNQLKNTDIVAYFEDGNYNSNTLKLNCIGNAQHQLLIKAKPPEDVVFNGPHQSIDLKGCQNICFENLNFTGQATGYAFKISKHCNSEFNSKFNSKNRPTVAQIIAAPGTVSKNITLKNCNFYDMKKLYYGAIGVSFGSHHITIENCTFKNIGLNSHAHMMYNAYNADHVTIRNCYFQDCAGSYVRFRNASDYGTVTGCKFVSTGKYINKHPKAEVFVECCVFNDVDPGDECFGNNFIITSNSFKFASSYPQFRSGIRFHHSGFNPPGWNYLMTAEQGAILEGKNGLAKKKLLKKNCGIDFDRIKIVNNDWKNEKWKIQFTSKAHYGAKSKGWQGYANISDILD